MKRLAFSLSLALAALAAARQHDGTLGLIQTPNNGLPALVLPGGTFEATLREEARLALVGDAHTIPLNTTWRDVPGPAVVATCTVPARAPQGAYAIEAQAEDGADHTARAVYVLESFPETYTVAHVSDTHIGKDQRHPRVSDAINRDLAAAVNNTDAAFTLITGDLTETGALDEYRRFLEILDLYAMPTFVCAGNHDRLEDHYERFFGPLAYTFWFGKDGYLAFDTKDFLVADELGRQDADIEVYRRALKPARWTVGFTHRFEPSMGMRSQITLFVDNPLDFLLVGHRHRANTEEETRVPWGSTPISIVPAAIDGRMRLIQVDPVAIQPNDVIQAAKVTK
ncbi:MAG TPA: hypothetical protein ENN80_00930 [Candidatus Hydrogenedentes bacterium]|nr:hypothetical protein [Candidatus Hydrogenedentota bacterium]